MVRNDALNNSHFFRERAKKEVSVGDFKKEFVVSEFLALREAVKILESDRQLSQFFISKSSLWPNTTAVNERGFVQRSFCFILGVADAKGALENGEFIAITLEGRKKCGHVDSCKCQLTWFVVRKMWGYENDFDSAHDKIFLDIVDTGYQQYLRKKLDGRVIEKQTIMEAPIFYPQSVN